MEQSTGGGLDDRTFEDYDPSVEWSHGADADTVTISLPGKPTTGPRASLINSSSIPSSATN
jgi:hypothetical protein